MIDFLKEAKAMEQELIELRRDFHMHPELGFEEYRTSSKIKEILKSLEIEYKEVANTGICAYIKGEAPGAEKGKVIALRADMDALPLEDKKSCEYSSKNQGKMHACGHDAHTTILLGAAKILNNHKSEIKGTIKLLFEPAEETVGGAKYMINEGVLQNPKVDAVIGLHVSEDVESGKISIKKGVVNAASNPFTLRIKGKGGHGAHPESTIDPIVAASHFVVALQTIVSREIPPVYPAVVTVGSFSGGTAQNIIPEDVVLKGIMRTLNNAHRNYVKKRFVDILEGICRSFRVSYEIEIEESYPCLYNDDDMVQHVINTAEEIIEGSNVLEQQFPSMGVESFAYFSNEIPAAFYFLGTQNNERGINHPAHGSYFDIDENSLHIGAALQAAAAFKYLSKD
ncbi:M20 metallopeptidase family protein [Clostridium polynesiense]|uniref:M20 metallopeptidase family protein n=1 Tax=Clostridium polynesiense TaxID=1325933 RepID=UPI0005915555|nr:amidohydrolase [Clostridium polynesiense]